MPNDYQWDECGVRRALTKSLPAKGGRATVLVHAKSPAEVRVRRGTIETLI